MATSFPWRSAPLSNLVAKRRTASFTADAPVRLHHIFTGREAVSHKKKDAKTHPKGHSDLASALDTPLSQTPPPQSPPPCGCLAAGPGMGLGLGSVPHHLLWSKSTYQGPVKATPHFQFSGLLAGLGPFPTGLSAPKPGIFLCPSAPKPGIFLWPFRTTHYFLSCVGDGLLAEVRGKMHESLGPDSCLVRLFVLRSAQQGFPWRA